MSTILPTPFTTQQQRIFSSSNWWRKQAVERQQLVNDHLTELKAKMPANATHVHVTMKFHSRTIKKVMTFEQYRKEAFNDYVQLGETVWAEGVQGGDECHGNQPDTKMPALGFEQKAMRKRDDVGNYDPPISWWDVMSHCPNGGF